MATHADGTRIGRETFLWRGFLYFWVSVGCKHSGDGDWSRRGRRHNTLNQCLRLGNMVFGGLVRALVLFTTYLYVTVDIILPVNRKVGRKQNERLELVWAWVS